MARKYKSIRDVERRADNLFKTALKYTEFKSPNYLGGIGWNNNLDKYTSMIRKATRNISNNVRNDKIKEGDKRYGRMKRRGIVAG